MSVDSSSDELVIRPCTKQYKQMLKATPVFLAIPMFFFIMRDGLFSVALAVITAAVCVVVMFFYFRGVHVVVTHIEIGRSGFTSRRKMRPRSDIAQLVIATIPLSVIDSRNADNLFVLDHDGRSITRLRSTHWTKDDMTRVVQRLGLRPVVHQELVSAAEFSSSYPRALPWIERLTFGKIILYTFGFVILLFVVIGVVVALTI